MLITVSGKAEQRRNGPSDHPLETAQKTGSPGEGLFPSCVEKAQEGRWQGLAAYPTGRLGFSTLEVPVCMFEGMWRMLSSSSTSGASSYCLPAP
jgi:hypothetical protein